MSDCIDVVTFNKDTLRLEMRFDGDNYETASVKFSLHTIDHGPSLEEDVTIPVRCLFAMGYLLLMSVRRTAVQYEQEVQEMIDKIEHKKHPFKHRGGENDKKDKKTSKSK